jgi:hypothetical protein
MNHIVNVSRRKHSILIILGLVASVVIVGLSVRLFVTDSHKSLLGRLTDLRLPIADMQLRAEDRYGNRLCLDACPSVTRIYSGTGSVEQRRSAVRESLRSAGFELQSDTSEFCLQGVCTIRASRGQEALRVTFIGEGQEVLTKDGSFALRTTEVALEINLSLDR